ncbi:hypothetical protein UF75_4974 [Desulfosporosinus sp. I2]|nr:hypothetical protein UF75_4974 [Desulfosporosinus sp. I2]
MALGHLLMMKFMSHKHQNLIYNIPPSFVGGMLLFIAFTGKLSRMFFKVGKRLKALTVQTQVLVKTII